MNKDKIDIIKIGGSVITDKLSYKKLNSDTLTSISEVIAKWGQKCIIVHGAGSFGHILADKHSITSGYTEFSQLNGIVQIRIDMGDLTKKVVESLQKNKLHAISFQTSSIVYSQGKENELSYFIEPIQKALDLGILPVLSGDIIFKQQSAFGTRFCIAPEVRGLAVGCRANKNRPAILTPVLTFGLFLANWTLFHLHTLHKTL